MTRTPDQFPGERIEEGILFDSGTLLPLNVGEMLYASGTVSGSGFFFNEEGTIVGPLRNLTGSSSSTSTSPFTVGSNAIKETGSVAFGSDNLYANEYSAQAYFFTSGTIGLTGSDAKLAVFGGDQHTSGSLRVKRTILFVSGEFDNGNSGTSKTIDWRVSQKQKLTLSGNCAISFIDPPGIGNLMLKVVQGATGSNSASFPSNTKYPGGTPPTLSTAIGSIDLYSYYFDGTSYFAVANMGFA